MNNSQYHFMSINNVLAKPITQCQVIIRTKYKVKVIPDIVPVNSRKDICLLLAVSPPPLTKDSDDGPKVISHVIPSPGPGPTHLSSQGRWSPIFCSNSDRGVIIGPNTEAEACDGYDELTCRPLGTLLHIWAWNQSFGSCRQLWISGVEGSPCTSSSLQAQMTTKESDAVVTILQWTAINKCPRHCLFCVHWLNGLEWQTRQSVNRVQALPTLGLCTLDHCCLGKKLMRMCPNQAITDHKNLIYFEIHSKIGIIVIRLNKL